MFTKKLITEPDFFSSKHELYRIDGLHSAYLPSGTIQILQRVLGNEPSGYIWLLDYRLDRLCVDVVQEKVPSCFGENTEERDIQIHYITMDIILKAKIFMKYLDVFKGHVDLVYSLKPKPRKLHLASVPDANKPRLFEQNQIEFFFSIPHQHEHSLVVSDKKEIVDRFVASVRSPDQT